MELSVLIPVLFNAGYVLNQSSKTPSHSVVQLHFLLRGKSNMKKIGILMCF